MRIATLTATTLILAGCIINVDSPGFSNKFKQVNSINELQGTYEVYGIPPEGFSPPSLYKIFFNKKTPKEITSVRLETNENSEITMIASSKTGEIFDRTKLHLNIDFEFKDGRIWFPKSTRHASLFYEANHISMGLNENNDLLHRNDAYGLGVAFLFPVAGFGEINTVYPAIDDD